jgi:hypothetical protein
MNSYLSSQDRNEAEEAKEKSSGLFDPTSEAFTSSFKVTVSLLVTAVVAGLIWHFGRYRRKMKNKEKQLDELGKFFIFDLSINDRNILFISELSTTFMVSSLVLFKTRAGVLYQI